MARAELTKPVNIWNAERSWGADMPRYVSLLAEACDAASQREVGQRIGFSSATISKVLNCRYPGSYEEVETQVLAAYAGDRVHCPAWNEAIPLASCVSARRRPHHGVHQLYARHCPQCPNNLDREKSA